MEEDKELETLNKVMALLRDYLCLYGRNQHDIIKVWDFFWDFSEGNDIEYLIKKLKEILSEVN